MGSVPATSICPLHRPSRRCPAVSCHVRRVSSPSLSPIWHGNQARRSQNIQNTCGKTEQEKENQAPRAGPGQFVDQPADGCANQNRRDELAGEAEGVSHARHAAGPVHAFVGFLLFHAFSRQAPLPTPRCGGRGPCRLSACRLLPRRAPEPKIGQASGRRFSRELYGGKPLASSWRKSGQFARFFNKLTGDFGQARTVQCCWPLPAGIGTGSTGKLVRLSRKW